MAVTRRAVGTTEHFSGGGTSPQTSAGTANITIASGDTAVLLGVTYGVQGASTTSDIAMTVTCGGVSMTAVSGTKTLDHSGTNGGGVTQWFILQDPVTAIGSTGAKTITAVSTFTTTGTISAKMILIPVVVTGTLGTITGGHAISADAVPTISSGSLTVGTGGYGIAIAANGSTQPTVNTGTSVAGVTGSGFTGSDNALALDRTSDGALIANTDSGDESQLSWVTIASGGGPTVLQGAGATTVTFGQSGLGVLAIAALAASTLTFGQTGAATSKQQALAPTTVNFTPSAVPGGGPQAGAGATTLTFTPAATGQYLASGATTLTFGQTAASTSKQQALAPTTVTFAPSAIPTGGPQAAAGATTLTFTPVAAGAFVASTSAALTFTPAATGVVTKAPTTAPTTVTFTPSAAPLAGGAGAGGTTVTFSASATGLSKQQATAPATVQFYPSAYFASTTTPGATGGKALTFQYALRGNALTDNPEQAQANDQRDRDLENFLDGMSTFVGYGAPPVDTSAWGFYALATGAYTASPVTTWALDTSLNENNMTKGSTAVTMLVSGLYKVHAQFAYHGTTAGLWAVARVTQFRGATPQRIVDGVGTGNPANGYGQAISEGLFVIQANDTFSVAFQSNINQTIDRDGGGGEWRSYLTLDKIG